MTDQKQLPILIYPAEQFWDVYVSHVNSTVNVFVRLLGDEYSTKYEEMVTNMELFYFDKGVDVVLPQVGIKNVCVRCMVQCICFDLQ